MRFGNWNRFNLLPGFIFLTDSLQLSCINVFLIQLSVLKWLVYYIVFKQEPTITFHYEQLHVYNNYLGRLIYSNKLTSVNKNYPNTHLHKVYWVYIKILSIWTNMLNS